MEISFHSHLDSEDYIITKFCIWHDRCAGVACTKNCCYPIANNWITTRRSFHAIWIMSQKTLGKRTPAWWTIENVQSQGVIFVMSQLTFSAKDEVIESSFFRTYGWRFPRRLEDIRRAWVICCGWPGCKVSCWGPDSGPLPTGPEKTYTVKSLI